VTLRLAPGLIVAGTLNPLTPNGPETATFDIVTAARPAFNIVIESILLVPASMLPKLADVGLNSSAPWAPAAWLAVIPPTRITAHTNATRIPCPPAPLRFNWKFAFGP
jgi:hypothetical protein